MDYMTISDASEKWGISRRRIQVLCTEGSIEVVIRFGRQWAIPESANKPSDARIKTGKYIKGDIDL